MVSRTATVAHPIAPTPAPNKHVVMAERTSGEPVRCPFAAPITRSVTMLDGGA